MYQEAGWLGCQERPEVQHVSQKQCNCVTQCVLHTGWRSCDHPTPSSSHTQAAASLRGTMEKGVWAATSSLALCLGLLAEAAELWWVKLTGHLQGPWHQLCPQNSFLTDFTNTCRYLWKMQTLVANMSFKCTIVSWRFVLQNHSLTHTLPEAYCWKDKWMYWFLKRQQIRSSFQVIKRGKCQISDMFSLSNVRICSFSLSDCHLSFGLFVGQNRTI